MFRRRSLPSSITIHFVQRMKDFPVTIEMMSRFRTAAQQKKTIEDLKKGLVDIVIGTHRVLVKGRGV